MRKIKLYGELGRKFGKEYRLKVHSPSEAVRALSSQLPGFKKYLIDSEKDGVRYKVFSGSSLISNTKELSMSGAGDVHISPEVTGANGEFRGLLGGALIAAAFFFPPVAAAAPYLLNAGLGLAIGGALEIMTRGMTPSTSPYEAPENRPSNSFSGPVNTVAQGHPVPVGYGRVIIGAQVISARISIKTIMAGYKPVISETYVDLWSHYTDAPPKFGVPPNYKRREEIDRKPMYIYFDKAVPGGPTQVGYQYLFRYYYDQTTYELVTV